MLFWLFVYSVFNSIFLFLICTFSNGFFVLVQFLHAINVGLFGFFLSYILLISLLFLSSRAFFLCCCWFVIIAFGKFIFSLSIFINRTFYTYLEWKQQKEYNSHINIFYIVSHHVYGISLDQPVASIHSRVFFRLSIMEAYVL